MPVSRVEAEGRPMTYTEAWCSHVPEAVASFYAEDGLRAFPRHHRTHGRYPLIWNTCRVSLDSRMPPWPVPASSPAIPALLCWLLQYLPEMSQMPIIGKQNPGCLHRHVGQSPNSHQAGI